STSAARVRSDLEGGTGSLRDLWRYAAFRQAACVVKQQDPLRGLGMIENALGVAPPETSLDRRRWMSLLASAARDAGRPERVEPWIDRLHLSQEEGDALRKRLRGASEDPLAAGRAEALSWIAQGRTREAMERIESLRAHDPSDPRLLYDLGRLLQMEGRFEEARPHLAAAAHSASADLAGWAMIRLGWDDERAGRRAD